uniref:Uncharacterized protein n=1 Tax=Tanacetum cinerariifolium TaxID=118510 RepID=A0A6L2P791_TANCI|nr:hypothetical protein [Tanacetum cinerariifolium]
MLKVAKNFEPKKSFLLSFGEVNADSVADESLSRTAVQSTSQPKEKTDTKSRKKKIPSSSEPKTYIYVNQSLDAFKQTEEVRRNLKPPLSKSDEDELADSDKQLSATDEIEATNVIDEILTEINTKDTTTLVFIAPSMSKSLPDKFSNKIDSLVPRMVVDALEESLCLEFVSAFVKLEIGGVCLPMMDRRGMPTWDGTEGYTYPMLCGIFWVSLVAISANANLSPNV